jgi:hypothetical protein
MANGLTTEVLVRRQEKDGWHVYTCDKLPGLYVAHPDDRVAYNDLPNAIRLLVKLDDGIDCTVSHKLTYEQFVQRIRLQGMADDNLRGRIDELLAEDDDGDYLPFIIQHTRLLNPHDISPGLN